MFIACGLLSASSIVNLTITILNLTATDILNSIASLDIINFFLNLFNRVTALQMF